MTPRVAGLVLVSAVAGCGVEENLLEIPRCEDGALEGETRACSVTGGCAGTQRCLDTASCDPREPSCQRQLQWTPCLNPELGQSCGLDQGRCRPGVLECHKGSVVCGGDGYVPPAPETCDGVDNDCNGVVDDMDQLVQLPEFQDLEVRQQGGQFTCYQGPAATRGVGACLPGFPRCALQDGHWVAQCVGQQLPGPRDCSNGNDNDCDGRVDAPGPGPVQTDLVLFMDRSPSMTPYTATVMHALEQFLGDAQAGSFGGDGALRVALVEMPKGLLDRVCVVRYSTAAPNGLPSRGPLMTLAEAEYQLHVMRGEPEARGDEPSWDCPWLAAHPDNPLGVDWRPGARRIFISLTDERGQSYPGPWPQQPPAELQQADVVQMLRGSAVVPRFHSFDVAEHAADFADLVASTGGQRFPLSRDQDALAGQLLSLLPRLVCE